MIKLSVNVTKWSNLPSQDRRSYSLYFHFKIWFRARKADRDFRETGHRSKTGVENNIFWSKIGSGFGELGGTPPPRIARRTPPIKERKSLRVSDAFDKNFAFLPPNTLNHKYKDFFLSKLVSVTFNTKGINIGWVWSSIICVFLSPKGCLL